MSHVVSIQAQVKNPDALIRACQGKNIPFTRAIGQKVDLYERAVTGDFSMKLPGWQFPLVIDTATGEAHYDNYGGRWGDERILQDFLQEYSLQVAEEQAYELTLQGWTVERQKQENGDIQLVIQQ